MPRPRPTSQAAERFADRRRSRTRSEGDRRGGTERSDGKVEVPVGRSITADMASLSGIRRTELPLRFEPELGTRAEAAPGGDEWFHEIKFDGYRLIARVEGRAVRLFSRNGKDWTARFPRLVETLADLEIDEAWLDGELVALQADGTSSFRHLQEALAAHRTDELIFEVFDLTHLNGYDLTGVALESRKLALKDLLTSRGVLAPRGVIRYVQHFEGRGDALLDEVCQLGLEGIMSKRRTSPYRSGRSSDWLKIKCVQQDEFIVGGYTNPSNARIGFGALLLGAYNEQGELCYIGSVGTGFSAQHLRTLYQRLREIEVERAPFAQGRLLDAVRAAHWVRPELVADVEFTEWTRDGALRHPVFRGLREDRSPEEIVLSVDSPLVDWRVEPPALRGTRMTRPAKLRSGEEHIAGVRLTHPDRVLYPDQGVTKAHLARYYEQIADRILPHLADRPLTLLRCPGGREKTCFYQKHPPDGLGDAARRVMIEEADGSGSAEYMHVDSIAGIVSLVQIGTLELHVWGSRVDAVETPDTAVFDLDPGPGMTWPRVIDAAHLLRERLDAIGVTSFPKLTGGKGLHLVVPLVPRAAWDRVKEFARTVAESVARDHPGQFTSNMAKSRRQGRIFIDYLRNGRGATAVCSYSTRARAGAPVAVPISWDELDPAARPDRYGIDTVKRRLAALRKEPWADFERSRRPITAEMIMAAAQRG